MKAFLIVILLFSFNSYGANQCMDLFRKTEKSIILTNTELQELALQVNHFVKNDDLANIMIGYLKPSWNHHNTLLELVEKTENLNKAQAQQITNALKFSSPTSKNENFNRFLDYNIAYFKLLDQLNKNLKTELIPIPSFKKIPTETQLIKAGIDIVNKIEKIADKTFYQKEFTDKNDFVNKTIKYNPKLTGLVDLLEKDLIVVIHRPESGRFWIPFAGFQNQRITESSRGAYYDDSNVYEISDRDKAEAHLTNTELNEYVPLSGRLKPNYGEARPAFFRKDIKFITDADHYGSDSWVIKKSVIESRATWTPTDSLSIGVSKRSDMFIPWKHKILMSLYAMRHFPDNFFTTAPIPDDFSTYFAPFEWDRARNYFEVQIFGPLNINDVEAFHFTENPPDKKLYELLKSKNIKVFDGRKNNEEYFGEESQ